MLSTISEKNMRYVRGVLALLWGVLILSLFWDPLTPHLTHPDNEASPFALREAPAYVQGRPIPEEPYPMGARIFWTMLVPIVPFFLLFFGHEAWRRVCPLSFMTQIPQYLGWQMKSRSFNRRTGGVDRNLRLVKAESWLGRNFWNVQFFFLYSGITARLVFINSDRIALAAFLLGIIAMAVVIGFVFGGKTWCNYVCPISPVQKIYTEPRGFLESSAVSSGNAITQSTCRTMGHEGDDQTACVGCISPCPDVDSERTYWEGLTNPGRRIFYYGYFGLVFGFYFYYYVYSGNWDYYFSGAWTHEPNPLGTLFDPGVYLNGVAYGIPKILAAPLTTGICIGISLLIWQTYAFIYRKIKTRGGRELSKEQELHHTFSISAWATINLFYLFGGRPNLNLLPPTALFIVDFFILSVSTMWMWRTLNRSRVGYEREGLASSFRRQLKKLKFNFKDAFDGRDIEDLDNEEVYVLAKTLPGFDSKQRRQVYKDVLRENLSSGKADKDNSKSALKDLRQQLGLAADDHDALQAELEIELAAILEMKDSGSQENWIRLNNYHSALEEIFVRLVDSGMPIKEALSQKPVVAEINQLRGIYTISEDEHQEFMSILMGDNNLLLDQAKLLMSGLKDMSARILSLTEQVPKPDSALMRLCRSFLESKRLTVTSQLLNILTSLSDTDDAIIIAHSLHHVVPGKVKEILEGSNRLVEGKTTQWEAHINPRVLEALLQLKGDKPVSIKPGQTIEELTMAEIRSEIPEPSSVLEDIFKDGTGVPSATALFALGKIHSQKARSLANRVMQRKGKTHWLTTEVAENLLGMNLKIKGSLAYTVHVEVESPGQPIFSKRFKKSEITIGRSSTNDIVIFNQSISQQHAVIHQDAKGIRIEDLGSAQGTKVGKSLYRSASTPIEQDQVVTLGSFGGGVKLKVTWQTSDMVSDVGANRADYRLAEADTMTTMLRLFDSKLFNRLSPEVLAELARGAESRMYRKDGMICRMGDASDKIFVVSNGIVNVYIDSRRITGTIERRLVDKVLPGESIGEMGIFTNQPRSTTCIAAETDTLMISIEGYDLMSIVGDNSKVATNFLTILSLRQQQIINKLMKRAS